MNRTKHAQQRIQQRGKGEDDIALIRKYGTRKGDDFVLTKRDADKAAKQLRRNTAAAEENADAQDNRRILQRLDHLVGWRVVTSGEKIITVHPLTRRIRPPRPRPRPVRR